MKYIFVNQIMINTQANEENWELIMDEGTELHFYHM